jgi:hypothetical protein
MVRFGESFRLKLNQRIGLFGHFQHLRDGVKELQEIYKKWYPLMVKKLPT